MGSPFRAPLFGVAGLRTKRLVKGICPHIEKPRCQTAGIRKPA